MKRHVAWIVLVALLLTLVPMFRGSAGGRTRISMSEFREHLLAGHVARVSIWNEELWGELRDSSSAAGRAVTRFRCTLPPGTSSNWEFQEWLMENRNGAVIDAEPATGDARDVLFALLPHAHWPVLAGILMFIGIRKLRLVPAQQAPGPDDRAS